jgi:hypothetical protein
MVNATAAASRKLTTEIGGTLLFVFLFLIVFGVPLFPAAWQGLLYRSLYTTIFFMSVLSLERHRELFLPGAAIVAIVSWVASGREDAWGVLGNALHIGFFMLMVLTLILQIARTKRVDARVILAAINAYLLLGMGFSVIVAIIDMAVPGAFGFPDAAGAASKANDHIYYAFVTLTTVGYGDVVPKAPYAKSLAILAGVSGQMYVAIVIALLVGKFSSSAK